MMIKAIDEKMGDVTYHETPDSMQSQKPSFNATEPKQQAIKDDVDSLSLQRAIESAVLERINSGALDDAIAKGIEKAIASMEPRILDDFHKVAKEMALGVAEEMVKKTIDQIKSD
jgi:hypothetical protein